MDPKVGTVCGKLLTIRATFDLPDKQLVDSTGIYFTPMLRHLDRGSQEVDNGHYLNFEYVFGATAAAALYRRQMIDDISIRASSSTPDFFVYREDADVAWRAQLMGWRCIYTPLARGYHVRNVLPGNRRALPPVINMHSVKNRFLMRIKNMTPDLYRRNWLVDHGARSGGGRRVHSARARSLKAFWYLARNWKRVMAKRREIMKRRRAKDDYISSWFSYEPVSRPAPEADRAGAGRVAPPAAEWPPAIQQIRCDSRSSAPAASRPLWRFRDFRRRAFDAAGGARSQHHRLLPRKVSRTLLPRRASEISAHHPAQIFRHGRAHLFIDVTSWLRTRARMRCFTATPRTRCSPGSRASWACRWR